MKNMFNANKSIKNKIIVGIVPFIILFLAISTIISITISKEALTTNTESYLNALSQTASDSLNENILGDLRVLETISRIDTIASENLTFEEKKATLDFYKNKEQYKRIGIADLEGNFISTDGWTTNIKEDDYFKNSLKGLSVPCEPATTTGSYEFGLSVPVFGKNTGEVIGVLICVKEGAVFQNVISDLEASLSTTAMIVNGYNTIIAASNTDNLFKEVEYSNLKDSTQKLDLSFSTQKPNGNKYSVNDKKSFVEIQTLPVSNWLIIMDTKKSDVLGAINIISIVSIVSTILIAIACTYLVTRRTKTITTPLNYVVDALYNMSNKDLTTQFDKEYLQQEDEIGELSRAINGSQGAISSMIKTLQDIAVNIDGETVALSNMSDEFTETTKSITDAIEEVATGVTKQSNDISTIIEKLESFKETLNGTTTEILSIAGSINSMNYKAENSNKDMTNFLNSIDNLATDFDSLTGNIIDVKNSIVTVNEITELINNIASQINLLSLNAAIEAARAGESGKGFAVVAQEIKSLSDQTNDASKKISSLISSVIVKSEEMACSTSEVNDTLKNERVTVLNTMDAFKDISSSILEISPKIQEIATSSQEISVSGDLIVDMINEFSDLSMVIAANSEEISAASHEMSASSVTIAESSINLKESTQVMVDEFKDFKI
ncbi:MAG: methyl-accepting chemotaxis protein [Clostridium sp.]